MKSTALFRLAKQRKGFSLVEVLIAMVILAIALFAIAGVVVSTTMLMAHTMERETAVSLAGEKLDDLEQDYEDIANGSDNVDKYTREWVVNELNDVKTVEVSVTWNGVLGTRSVLMEREYAKFEL
jgi:prepilin-type N-terminal cleavage/methylation domain-containing protein